MKIVKHVVQVKNGNYISEWGYSQGYFSFAETNDILKGCEIDKETFYTFFNKIGGIHLQVNIEYNTLTIV